jgi:hypothetical protein
MKLSYIEQLRHPNWQRKRLEMLASNDWTCAKCAAVDKELHVHHLRYVKGRMAWEYEDEELQVLCNACHKLTHEELDALILEFGWTRWADVSKLLGGFYGSLTATADEHELARAGRIAQLVFMLDEEDAAMIAEACEALVNRMISAHVDDKAKNAESNPS